MKKSPVFLCLVLLLFLGNSCNLDSLDFSKLSDDLNLNPEVVAPLATADITVWDLIHSANNDNDDVIIKDPTTGLVKIVYKQDNLYTYNVKDFLNFPTQQNLSSNNTALGEVSPNDVSIPRKVTLDELSRTLPGAVNNINNFSGQTIIFQPYSFTGPTVTYAVDPFSDFTSVTLSKGTLEVKLENKLKIPITIEGILYDKTKQATIASVTFASIQPGLSSTQIFTLDGKELSNQIEFQLTKFTTPGSSSNTVLIDLQDYFNMTFNMKDLKVSSGKLMVKAQTLAESKGAMSFTFDQEPTLKAFGAVLKTGKLVIKPTNTSGLTGSVNITLPEIKMNGAPVTASIALNGSSTPIDLTGATINFASDATVPYNRVPYTYTVQVNKSSTYIDYVSTQTIKMDVALTNLNFKSISGDFGSRKITVDPGKFDMNVEMLDKIKGSFKLTDPKMNLIFHNAIGVPAVVSLDFSASNKSNQTVALNPNDFDLPIPTSINAGVKTETVTFNKSNSNIVNFIALPPTGQVSYSGEINFNKKVAVTPATPNFLDLDASFSIDLAMDLPLQLQTKDLAFSDTTKITGSDYNKIETADLVLTATNGLPLDIDIQLAFVDTTTHKQIGVSTKSKILTAAQVNATDNSITPVKSTNTFSLTKTDLENLRKSNSIVFTGFVSSPSAGTSVATILSTSKIALSVVIKSKVNL